MASREMSEELNPIEDTALVAALNPITSSTPLTPKTALHYETVSPGPKPEQHGGNVAGMNQPLSRDSYNYDDSDTDSDSDTANSEVDGDDSTVDENLDHEDGVDNSISDDEDNRDDGEADQEHKTQPEEEFTNISRVDTVDSVDSGVDRSTDESSETLANFPNHALDLDSTEDFNIVDATLGSGPGLMRSRDEAIVSNPSITTAKDSSNINHLTADDSIAAAASSPSITSMIVNAEGRNHQKRNPHPPRTPSSNRSARASTARSASARVLSRSMEGATGGGVLRSSDDRDLTIGGSASGGSASGGSAGSGSASGGSASGESASEVSENIGSAAESNNDDGSPSAPSISYSASNTLESSGPSAAASVGTTSTAAASSLVHRYKNIRAAFDQDGAAAYHRLSHLLRHVFDGGGRARGGGGGGGGGEEEETVISMTPEEEAAALINAAGEGDIDKCLEILSPQESTTAATTANSRPPTVLRTSSPGIVKEQRPATASLVITSFNTIVDLKVEGKTALHVSARNGHFKVVETLMRFGANPSEVDEDGNNALHHAVLGKEPMLVEMLVNGCASSNTQHQQQQQQPRQRQQQMNGRGFHNGLTTPASMSTTSTILRRDQRIRQSSETTPREASTTITTTTTTTTTTTSATTTAATAKTATLVAFNATLCDINARNKQKKTALHLGVDKAFQEVVRLLLVLGAHPNLQDENGSTPLHEAVRHPGHEDVTALLLRHKADFNVVDGQGCNPIHLAAILVRNSTISYFHCMHMYPKGQNKHRRRIY